jgi:phytoene synthase
VSPDTELLEARTTTQRVARTFALACRLLPRDVRDDVYLLYLVFRTLDDAVDFAEPGADACVAAVEAWCETGAVGSREARILDRLDQRYGLPRDAMLDFCRGMRDDLAGTPVLTEEALEVYCYRVAGTVGIVMSALLGTRPGVDARPSAAAPGQGDAAHEHPARHRRGPRRGADLPRPGDRHEVRVARAGQARGAAARPDRPRRRAVRRGHRRDPAAAQRPAAIRAAAFMYREILRQIEREGYGARPGRVVVPRSRKLLIAARRVSA